MCNCIEPVKHSCGRFAEYIAIADGYDVYYCEYCDRSFRRLCEVLVSDVRSGDGNYWVDGRYVTADDLRILAEQLRREVMTHVS